MGAHECLKTIENPAKNWYSEQKTIGVIFMDTPCKEGDKNQFAEDELIRAYRDKNQIKQAFKDVKSSIKIQPFNVWAPKHAKAHYTLCVLSHLLDITIANRLKGVDIGVRSLQKVYVVLKDGII